MQFICNTMGYCFRFEDNLEAIHACTKMLEGEAYVTVSLIPYMIYQPKKILNHW